MVTRNGVCYHLEKSPYTVTEGNITFHFSSKLHLRKFLETLEKNRESINESLANRFKIYVESNELADLMLYRKIECRGFHIVISGEAITWPNGVELNGQIVKSKLYSGK